MSSDICSTCSDSGYLDISPVTYCDCPAGLFYEAREERNLQVSEGLLDIGQCDNSEYEYYDENMPCENYDNDWIDNIDGLERLFKSD